MTPRLSTIQERLNSVLSSPHSSSSPTPSPGALPETTEATPSSPVAFHDEPTIEKLGKIVRQRLNSVCLVITAPTRDKPNRDWGTGCLIRGGLLLTNAHVISSKEEARKATISFIRIIGENPRSKTMTFEAVDSIRLNPDIFWVNSSPAGEDALGNQQPARFGALDYTVVAIEPHPFIDSIQRHAFSIFGRIEIEKNRDICVLQHPKIHPRKGGHTYGASYWTDGIVGSTITSCFIHYSAHTVGGSSGGAVVSGEDGRLLALHYQGETHCGCHEIHRKCNAGVNINAIVADLFSQQADVAAKIEERAREIDLRYQQNFVNQLHVFYDSKYKSDDHSRRRWFNPRGNYTDLVIIEGKPESAGKKIESLTDRQTNIRKTFYKPGISIPIKELFVQRGLSETSQKRAIIYGGAGVGKSAFSEMAALEGLSHWSQFSSIILIKLRNLHSYPNLALRDYSIEEILAGEHGGSLRELAATSSLDSVIDFREFLRGTLVKESLLILDGFDELPPETLSDSGSLKNVFVQLLSTFNHILITSRPGVFFHMHSIQSWPKFEIKGFDEVGIDSFIRNFYQQLEERREISEEDAKKKIEKLQERLKNIPILHNLVQTPLNLAFACLMFNDNDAIFDLGATLSLTRLYYEMVNRSYSNFLLHPGLLQSFKHDPREDLAFDSSIQPIDQVFQCTAWEMMEKKILQIPARQFTAILRKKGLKYDSDLFKTCGIMRCENGAWEFNHLTFQEYFAAVYLAHLFIDGQEEEEGRSYLSEIKFDPAYALTLRMTAGYLSIMDDDRALNRFFNYLYAKPRDLAIKSERITFANCFAECVDLKKISQHSVFVDDCVHYFEEEFHHVGVLSLLVCHARLLKEEKIICSILSHLGNEDRSLEMVSILKNVTKIVKEDAIPVVIINALVEQVFKGIDSMKFHALSALEEIAKEGSLFEDSIVDALKSTLQNLDLNRNVREGTVRILGEIAKKGGKHADKIIESLLSVLFQERLDIRLIVAKLLGEIVKEKEEYAQKIIDNLIVRAKAEAVDSHKKWVVFEVLLEIAKGGGVHAGKMAEELILLSRIDCEGSRGNVINVLGELIIREDERANRLVNALFNLFTQPKNAYEQRAAAIALSKVVERGGPVLQTIQEEVISYCMSLLVEENGDNRKTATEIFQRIVKNSRIDLDRVFNQLIEIFKTLGSSDTYSDIFSVLDTMAHINEKYCDDLLNALISSISKESCKHRNIEYLTQLAKGKGVPSERAINALYRIVQNTTSFTISPNVDSSTNSTTVEEVGDDEASPGEILIEAQDTTFGLQTREEAIYALESSYIEKVVKEGSNFNKALSALVEIVQKPPLDGEGRIQAASALERINKTGGTIPEEVMSNLIEIVEDKHVHIYHRTKNAIFLGKIANGAAIPEKGITALIELTKDLIEGGFQRFETPNKALIAVAKIAKMIGEEAQKYIVESLMEKFRAVVVSSSRLSDESGQLEGNLSTSFTSSVPASSSAPKLIESSASEEIVEETEIPTLVKQKWPITAILLQMIKRGIAIPKEVIREVVAGLEEIIRDSRLSDGVRKSFGYLFGKFARTCDYTPEEIANILIPLCSFDALIEYEKKFVAPLTISPEETSPTATSSNDPELFKPPGLDKKVKKNINDLILISQLGGEIPLETIERLMRIARNSSLDQFDRRLIFSLLGNIARGKSTNLENAILIVNFLKDEFQYTNLSKYDSKAIINILKKMIKLRGIIAEQAIDGLVKIVHYLSRPAKPETSDSYQSLWRKWNDNREKRTIIDKAVVTLCETAKVERVFSKESITALNGLFQLTTLELFDDLLEYPILALIPFLQEVAQRVDFPIELIQAWYHLSKEHLDSHYHTVLILKEVLSMTLLNCIADRSSFEFIKDVCRLTGRAMTIVSNKIFISDDFQQVFIRCPEYISETVEGIASTATSSSSSSSCSSSSGRYG